MRTKFTFLLSTALIMGGHLSAFAGAEVTTPENDGIYLLKNVAADKYLCPGNSWGTQASLSTQGMLVQLATSGDGYTISTQPYYGSNRYVTENGYVDTGNPTTWTFTKVEGSDNTYTISTNSKTLAWDGSTTTVNVGAATSNTNEQWQFIKVTTDDASTTNPVDLSHLIRNASCEENEQTWTYGWTKSGSAQPGTVNADASNRNWEIFNGTGSAKQTLTGLPNGKYKVTCKGFYRAGDPTTAKTAKENNTEAQNAYFIANNEKVALKSIFEGDGKLDEVGNSVGIIGKLPNSCSESGKYFNAGDFYNNEIELTIADGTLTLGIQKDAVIASDWAIFDDFHLYYLGSDDAAIIAQAKADYAEIKKEGDALLESSDYTNVKGTERKNLSSSISKTEDDITPDNITEIKSVYNTAKAAFVAAKSTYDEMNLQIAYAEAMGVDVQDYKSALESEETTADNLKTKLNEINVAEYNAAKDLKNIGGTYLPSWTLRGVAINGRGDQHWQGSKGDYYESTATWGSTSFTGGMIQSCTLPAGSYVFKFFCRNTPSATATATVKFGSESKNVNFPVKSDTGVGINTDGEADFNTSDSYANNNIGRGWEWRFIPFTLNEESEVSFDFNIQSFARYQYPGWGQMELLTKTQDVTLKETENFEQKATAANVTLTRPMNQNRWNTIVLPFSVTADQVKSQFGEEAIVASYTGNTGNTLNFKTETEGMQANVPYMVKPSTTAPEAGYKFDDVIMVKANEATSGEGTIQFVGNYKNGVQLTTNDYFISSSGDETIFYQASGVETMKAYRAIFKAADAATESKVLNFSLDGSGTTGISDIDAASKADAYNVYNLNGMLVKKNAASLEGLAKGIYIVNGKKYIVE